MQEKGSSDNHQVNNLKVVIDFANFLGPDITFYEVSRKEEIISFLNRKIKALILTLIKDGLLHGTIF
jgi:hypothetical protein